MNPRKLRVVTPQQLEEGYYVFNEDEVPNMTRHPYEVHSRLPDGNYVIREPEDEFNIRERGSR